MLANVALQLHPALPEDLLTALKFGLCLPPEGGGEVSSENIDPGSSR